MKLSTLVGWFVACVIVCAGQLSASAARRDEQPNVPVKGVDGSASVDITYRNWKDDRRKRTVPVKIYSPHRLAQPAPVVLFSHGLGGSTEAAIYLGNYWASHGYVCFFLQHQGSDESVWNNAKANPANPEPVLQTFRSSLRSPMNGINRVWDVHFAIDQIEKLNETDPVFKNKLNENAIAIAGHSFGSWTALAASGQRFATRANKVVSGADTRLKAAIYLSPTPAKGRVDPATIFGSIAIPGLHITGTLDDSPVSGAKATERRIPFDHISRSDQYLLILNGADHMVFNGRPRRTVNPLDTTHQNLVKETTLKFLDAYLKNDKSAVAWLRQQAPTQLKDFGTYEFKLVKR